MAETCMPEGGPPARKLQDEPLADLEERLLAVGAGRAIRHAVSAILEHHQVQFRRARKATKAAAIAASIAPLAMIRAAVARRFDPLAFSAAACAA